MGRHSVYTPLSFVHSDACRKALIVATVLVDTYVLAATPPDVGEAEIGRRNCNRATFCAATMAEVCKRTRKEAT